MFSVPGEHRAPEAAHDAFDATAHVEREIEILHAIQRETRHPFAKLGSDGELSVER